MTRLATAFGRVNPVTLWIDGLDWFGRSRRTAFVSVFAASALCLALFAIAQQRADWPRIVAVLAILGAALLFVPLQGHAMRRLNDLGWSGWWGWLMVMPGVGLAFALVLALKRGRTSARQSGSGLRMIGLALAWIMAALIAARAIWAPYTIVSEAMSPTLQAGDLIAVNTLARQYRRGDVVVFRHPVSGQDSIMRLIALPGERVQLRDGQVFIDDVAVAIAPDGTFSEPYGPRGPAGAYPLCANGVVGFGATCEKARMIETLPGDLRHATLNVGDRSLDNTGVFTVPEGQVFVLGDNRDNATDSRVPQMLGGPGFVPRDMLVGRASAVILSAPGPSLLRVWTWRPDRMMKVVR